uniref:Uncharacterized protein n=1 Tax=Cacopsylla melanoneura TaxID=428564 RepID=A0A8D9FH50_9HEMI
MLSPCLSFTILPLVNPITVPVTAERAPILRPATAPIGPPRQVPTIAPNKGYMDALYRAALASCFSPSFTFSWAVSMLSSIRFTDSPCSCTNCPKCVKISFTS